MKRASLIRTHSNILVMYLMRLFHHGVPMKSSSRTNDVISSAPEKRRTGRRTRAASSTESSQSLCCRCDLRDALNSIVYVNRLTVVIAVIVLIVSYRRYHRIGGMLVDNCMNIRYLFLFILGGNGDGGGGGG